MAFKHKVFEVLYAANKFSLVFYKAKQLLRSERLFTLWVSLLQTVKGDVYVHLKQPLSILHCSIFISNV